MNADLESQSASVVGHKTVRSGGRNSLLINITEECTRLGLQYGDHIKITIEKED